MSEQNESKGLVITVKETDVTYLTVNGESVEIRVRRKEGGYLSLAIKADRERVQINRKKECVK